MLPNVARYQLRHTPIYLIFEKTAQKAACPGRGGKRRFLLYAYYSKIGGKCQLRKGNNVDLIQFTYKYRIYLFVI